MIDPDNDYYKNLTKVMKYIQDTIRLPLIPSIDKSINIKWYTDEAFVLHKGIRSHTGGFMAISTGGACVKYIEQKLSNKSSIESDLVGVDYVLIQVI